MLRFSNRLSAVFLLLCLTVSNGFAAPFRPILEENKRSPEESLLLAIAADIMSDTQMAARAAGTVFEVAGREKEADRILDVLARMKGSFPILVGPAGVGKTTTVTRAIQKSITSQYPNDPAFVKVLTDAVWVKTTAGKLAAIAQPNNPAGRMKAIDELFTAIPKLEKKYNRTIILYVDEIHNLDADQVEAMLEYLDSHTNPIHMVGSTNSDKFQRAFKENDAWLRRVQLVGVEELDEQTTISTLKKWWVKEIEKRYNARFNPSAIEAAVRLSLTLLPEAGRFDASIKVLQDVAVNLVRMKSENADSVAVNGDGKILVRDSDVYRFYQKTTGYPVNPYDTAELVRYMDGLRETISTEIIDQPRMINEVLGLFQQILTGSRRGMGVALLVGPTGTGKSELGISLAKHGFKNPNAFLRIDANEYQGGAHQLSKLLGAEAGLVLSKERSGVLCDYLDDPAKGKYGGVILIDEAERAHPDFWTRLMEFFETGSIVGGDGKRRFARKHIIILTSNRGDSILFPEKANQWTPRELKTRMDEITELYLKNLYTRKISGKDEFNVPVPILNRIDLYSPAGPIIPETAKKIVQKGINEFIAETEDAFRIQISVDEDLATYITALDYNLRDGARPILKRAKKVMQDARVKAMASMELKRGSQLRFSLDGEHLVMSAEGKEPLAMELPRRKSTDPLADPETRELLKNLPRIISEHLFGQEEVIRSVSRAVIAHKGSPAISKRPLCLFAIGSTGTGKTELGKAVARALYGSPDRAEVIPLGLIAHESQFNRIFGSEPGYIGSESERSFEQALRNNPQGGVIIWDEASNLGGQDKGMKETLFKKFYDLIDEGKWTSAATGETYDLSKYVFLFTGNDGEKLFFSASEDDIRQQVWENNHSRAQVRGLLLESGVPQAFIGRMADTFLFRPLMRNEVYRIAQSRLDPVIKSFTDRGMEVSLTDEFYRSFAKSFFTQDTGARTIRAVAEDRVRGLMNQALIEVEYDGTPTDKIKLGLSMEDTLLTRPYRRNGDKERTVSLTVVAKKNDEAPIRVTEDLTEFADGERRMLYEDARAVAFHEAGHAVVNNSRYTDEELRSVTIVAREGRLGYASYERIPHKVKMTDRETVIWSLARVLAGQMAVVKAKYNANAGWGNDLERARGLATRYLVQWGLDPELEGIALDEKGNPDLSPSQREKVARKVDELIKEGEAKANEVLEAKWPLIRATVHHLMQKGTLTKSDFKALKDQFEKNGGFPVNWSCVKQIVEE